MSLTADDRTIIKPLNLNKVAQAISTREGGKINLSIAQIKEVVAELNVEIYLQFKRDDGEWDAKDSAALVRHAGSMYLAGEKRFKEKLRKANSEKINAARAEAFTSKNSEKTKAAGKKKPLTKKKKASK